MFNVAIVVTCNGCGVKHPNSVETNTLDANEMARVANWLIGNVDSQGWTAIHGSHYCPKCNPNPPIEVRGL